MKLPVLSAADGAEWEQRWVAAFERGAFPIEIVRRCVDVVDVLAVAAAGQGRAALLAADLRRLDADAVGRLVAAGVTPIGVVRRDDQIAQDRLRAAGVAHVVPDDAEPSVVAAVVAEAVRSLTSAAGGDGAGRADGPGVSSAARAYADPSTSMAIPPGAGPPVAADETTTRRGSVIAVWGPTGAPGRTTVAVSLADEIARLRSNALLVDADVYGGAIAAVLGLLDESPGLAAACRRAGSARLDAAALAGLCWQLGPQLRVLTGIPLASRWPELRPTAVGSVLAAARGLADYTVVDCGFCLETDEELSFDTLAPRRNGATLAVLDDADLIVAVGSADPIGMQRLVRALAELGDAEVAAPVWVVLNRVRAGAVPGDPASELGAALQRFAGRTPAALLPADGRALDAALASGRLLGECAPASPLRQALAELAAALVGAPAPAGRRQRRRRGR
ncbi:CpaE family protein [uncultured Jatrophihabitans sp.]|uniref:AAA family ATPase n=1 Tax=uncultured Jatrophihabitans sp. TaxID=1610747 RepID=UPI0035CB040B